AAPPPPAAASPAARAAALPPRNAHYQWFRAEGGGLPLPALVVARPGAFDAWMRSRGKLGGQHKVPRMDSTGTLTAELLAFLSAGGLIERELREERESSAADPGGRGE